MRSQSEKSFEETAREQTGPSLLGEFWQFLRCNKKWWLGPFVLLLLIMGLFFALSSSAAAPFIYTLF